MPTKIIKERIELFYSVPVIDSSEYNLTVRIGDAQPGDINVVYANCPFASYPLDNNSEWNTLLGLGKKLKDKQILLSSLTKNQSQMTDNVSIRVFINGNEIRPQAHSNDPDPHIKTVDKNDLIQFIQKIVFL